MLMVALASGAQATQLAPVIITGEGVGVLPASAQPGTGLCMASRVSARPTLDFPQTDTGFNAGLNTFLDTPPDASTPNARVTSVLRTWFDLSNNNTSGLKLSYGDFENVAPGCKEGGCDFFAAGTSVSFGTRLRGYLNVTPTMTGIPVHFGFYADDAVALTIYDRQALAYPVINRPPELGLPTWRTTNSV